MSTPISRALGLPALLVLAGCVGELGGALRGSQTSPAPRQVAVTADAVMIAGPRGFCADPTATSEAGDTGFVLLGNCAAISGRARAPQPEVAAVLIATVSTPSGGGTLAQSLPELDGYFRSDAGRALLSRSGDADTVEILETRREDAMFLLHARDTSADDVVGVSQDYWRAYMDVGARVVTLSILTLTDNEVADEVALAVLMRFAETVRAANPGGA